MILRTTFQENPFNRENEHPTTTLNETSNPVHTQQTQADLEEDLLELKKDLDSQLKQTIEGSGKNGE